MKISIQPSTFAAALVCGGLMLSAAADAATVTPSVTPDNPFSLSLTDIEFPPSLVLSFGQFNPVLGTLTGVVYRLDSSIDALIDVIADGPAGSGVEVIAQADFGVSGPGISASESLFPSASCTAEFGDCGSTGEESSLFTGDDLDPRFVVAAADFGAYQGVGTVDVTLSILGTIIDIACSGSAEVCTIDSAAANWSGSLVIEYIYTPGTDTPVPVPATLVLFGAGLLALGGFNAQRRA